MVATRWLVVAAVAFSLVAAYVYLRVIVVMFFAEPAPGVSVGRASGMTWVPVALGAIASAYLGLFPGPLLDLVTLGQHVPALRLCCPACPRPNPPIWPPTWIPSSPDA